MPASQLSNSADNSARKTNWTNLLFFTLTPLASLIFVPLHIYLNGLSWGLVAFFFVCFAISNLSITCGYHRYFSHRSYEVHPFIRWLYIIIGAGAFQGSVLAWSTDHRRHHREVDTDDDPYSINKGFWYAHLGWILLTEEPKHAHLRCPDLEKDKWVVWQDKYYPWIATFVGFILPGIVAWMLGLGFWAGVIFGGAFRIVVSNHTTFFINSACHYFGRQPYTDTNTARDSFIMAVLTFGEGYHNFHHMFQADYRNGIRWYHWDPTKWWIKSLALVGLASKLKKVSKEDILKAKLQMEEKLLVAKGASSEYVAALRLKVVEAQTRARFLREEMRRMKAQVHEQMRTSIQESSAAVKFAQLKADYRKATEEFQDAYAQWLAYQRAFQTARIR